MSVENPVTFQTRTRQLFRLRSFLTTLRKKGNTVMAIKAFKIVTGGANHTGVAIFNYNGHAIHVTPNQDGDPSSLVVYPVDKQGCIAALGSVFGPYGATLENLVQAKAWIDDEVTRTGVRPRVPAFLKNQAE